MAESFVTFLPYNSIPTLHGELFVWNKLNDLIKFRIERIFMITGVQVGQKRGGHAHKKCIQALICLTGTVNIKCIRNGSEENHVLSLKSGICIIPTKSWLELFNFSSDATTVIVLASENYDETDYIRDFQEFSNL